MLKFFPLKCLSITLFLAYSPNFVSAKDENTSVIATLLKAEGSVTVETKKFPKGKYAKTGMLLYEGNNILTALNSKASIRYRDGSMVRLFQNSSLVLNFSEEQSTKKRTFKYQLTLKNGSFRGRFRKGLQITKIRTPTAIIGIKGTSFRISEDKNNATVSLTSGKLEVSNLASKTILNTGQWLSNIDPYTDLTKNIAFLPNLLSLKTNLYELDFKDGKSKQIEFSLQIQNSINGKLLKRSGLVALESDYKKIDLPNKLLLNESGFTKILLKIDPPIKNDSTFIGIINIRAYMDDVGFDDVAEGLLVLKIINFAKKRYLLIHPDKGLIERKHDN